jgi:hypothetical protein
MDRSAAPANGLLLRQGATVRGGHQRSGIPYSAPLASVTARTLTRDPGGLAQFACMVFFDEFVPMLFSRSLAVSVSNSKMFQFKNVPIRNCSNSKLFTFEIVQIRNCSLLKLFKFEICSI